MKLLTERSEEKFWSSFNLFSSFFIYKSAGCRQSIFFTHIAQQTIFFTHIWEQTIFWGQLGKQTFFFTKKPSPPPLRYYMVCPLYLYWQYKQGLKYIHKSEVGCHGNLRSSNCLVDNRWSIKLSGFGLREFKTPDKSQPLEEDFVTQKSK